jgi:hypothetical protein
MYLRIIISDDQLWRSPTWSAGRELESNRICCKSGSADKGSRSCSHSLCTIGEIEHFDRRVRLWRSNVAKHSSQILHIRSGCQYRTYRIDSVPLTLRVDSEWSEEKREEE